VTFPVDSDCCRDDATPEDFDSKLLVEEDSESTGEAETVDPDKMMEKVDSLEV